MLETRGGLIEHAIKSALQGQETVADAYISDLHRLSEAAGFDALLVLGKGVVAKMADCAFGDSRAAGQLHKFLSRHIDEATLQEAVLIGFIGRATQDGINTMQARRLCKIACRFVPHETAVKRFQEAGLDIDPPSWVLRRSLVLNPVSQLAEVRA